MMEAQAVTRRDLETALIEKCWKDPEFKKTVLSDPKGMLERHIGQKLPAPLKVFIHEENANTLHFSIPPTPSNLTELSDDELEKVAGGITPTVVVILSIAATGLVASGAGGGAAVTVSKGW
jgi:Bacteriocin class II with double-glycine leader peptide